MNLQFFTDFTLFDFSDKSPQGDVTEQKMRCVSDSKVERRYRGVENAVAFSRCVFFDRSSQIFSIYIRKTITERY